MAGERSAKNARMPVAVAVVSPIISGLEAGGGRSVESVENRWDIVSDVLCTLPTEEGLGRGGAFWRHCFYWE